MGLFQSKRTICPEDKDYDTYLELATEDIKKFVTRLEQSESFYIRPSSVWYIRVPTSDETEKRIQLNSTVFLKMLKRFSVREFIEKQVDGDILIQFVHEGKSV